MEQVIEMYWESKRAPSYPAAFDRNPYRREKLIKKFYGRTKEERRANFKRMTEEYDEKNAKIDQDLAEAEIHDTQVVQRGRSHRRREIAKRRQTLGFNDEGKEEVDDPHMEELERKRKMYEMQVRESKERGNIDMPQDIEHI